MHVLFETAAGYAVFKLLDEGKIQKADDVWDQLNTPEKLQESLQLINFKKFKTTAEALEGAVDMNEGKLNKTLKKLLKKTASEGELAVGDSKLGKLIHTSQTTFLVPRHMSVQIASVPVLKAA
ncbi:hypothetical protein L596_010634 [Steinernema carpocapsae]|uniref:Nucleolar protein 58/56 N-terminal domain-containing protein n=1 Tax=Steinernema carpocapsae TaxID=34508 RepID=A0A4U5PJ70_STECR|nr:hypothetical protein L596_010634 [Steinernema carpocapsae]